MASTSNLLLSPSSSTSTVLSLDYYYSDLPDQALSPPSVGATLAPPRPPRSRASLEYSDAIAVADAELAFNSAGTNPKPKTRPRSQSRPLAKSRSAAVLSPVLQAGSEPLQFGQHSMFESQSSLNSVAQSHDSLHFGPLAESRRASHSTDEGQTHQSSGQTSTILASPSPAFSPPPPLLPSYNESPKVVPMVQEMAPPPEIESGMPPRERIAVYLQSIQYISQLPSPLHPWMAGRRNPGSRQQVDVECATASEGGKTARDVSAEYFPARSHSPSRAVAVRITHDNEEDEWESAGKKKDGVMVLPYPNLPTKSSSSISTLSSSTSTTSTATGFFAALTKRGVVGSVNALTTAVSGARGNKSTPPVSPVKSFMNLAISSPRRQTSVISGPRPAPGVQPTTPTNSQNAFNRSTSRHSHSRSMSSQQNSAVNTPLFGSPAQSHSTSAVANGIMSPSLPPTPAATAFDLSLDRMCDVLPGIERRVLAKYLTEESGNEANALGRAVLESKEKRKW